MRSTTLPLRAAITGAIFCTATVSGQVLMEDRFDTAPTAPWEFVRGETSVVDGWLHQTYTLGSSQETGYSVVGNGADWWTDYVFRIRADSVPNIHSRNTAAIFLRASNIQNASSSLGPNADAYILDVIGPGDALAGPRVGLTRIDNGVGGPTQVFPLTSLDRPWDIVVEARGQRIRVFINGVLHVNFLDSNGPTFGGVGVHSPRYAACRYDDPIVIGLAPYCPGDADATGSVDFADIAAVLASFGVMCR